MPLIISAPAKINLSLRIVGRRDDGYHELDSTVVFGGVADTLVIRPSDNNADNLQCASEFMTVDRNNTVYLALKALRYIIQDLPAQHITLHKRIPAAAGLGGGSADAAAVLRAMRAVYNLPAAAIGQAAMAVGADVPVCLYSRTARMQGIGEIVTPLPAASVRKRSIIIAVPPVEMPTVKIFAAYAAGVREAGQINDLLPAALQAAPSISGVLSALRAALPQALHVGLSGSGSACAALLTNSPTPATVAGVRERLPECRVFAGGVC